MGSDKTRFEAQPALHTLERRDLLGEVSKALFALATRIDDTRLAMAADARKVVMPVYEAARSVAAVNESFASALAPAISFYSNARKARKSSKTVPANGSDPTNRKLEEGR
jgi:hypothetical protein